MGNPAEIRPGSKTLAEIHSQPYSFQHAYEVVGERRKELAGILKAYPRVIFYGSGLSLNTAEIARDTHMALTGRDAFAVSAGEVFKRSDAGEIPRVTAKTLLAPISRTGNTTEVVAATQWFLSQNSRAHVLGITANPDSDLKKMYPDSIVVGPPDDSVVQTRSFTTMADAAHQLSAIAAGKYNKLQPSFAQMPESAYQMLRAIDGQMQELAKDDADLWFFCGRGMRHSVARAARLTVMEMSLTKTMEDKIMDGPHDTFTLVNSDTEVVVFLSDGEDGRVELGAANEARDYGGRTVIIAEGNTSGLDFTGHRTIFLATDVDQNVRNPLNHIPTQLMGYHRAIAKDLNPDKPLHLKPVVTYDTK